MLVVVCCVAAVFASGTLDVAWHIYDKQLGLAPDTFVGMALRRRAHFLCAGLAACRAQRVAQRTPLAIASRNVGANVCFVASTDLYVYFSST